ncbi:MAG: hypothetical protein BGN88_11765 [Clostridiales bacterium 43-6]|nr:MAG: hypothetical protein BGN88_11765 [Clostridiales bacterium 43-6]
MALTMNNQSYELALMIHNSDSSGEIPKVHLYQFINAMGTDGKEPVLPSVTLMDDIDKKIVASTGSAVFKGSRLRGFISNEETMWYLFVTNEIKSGLLTMHLDPKKPKETVSFEIFRSETEMKPVFSNQSVSMSIKIKLLVKLNEIAGETNYADGKQQNELEDKASEQLKENIMALIEKMKKEFDLDIFGFGNVVYQEKPLFFEKVKSSWDQQYQNLKVELQVQVKNKSTGVFNKAIEGD